MKVVTSHHDSNATRRLWFSGVYGAHVNDSQHFMWTPCCLPSPTWWMHRASGECLYLETVLYLPYVWKRIHLLILTISIHYRRIMSSILCHFLKWLSNLCKVHNTTLSNGSDFDLKKKNVRVSHRSMTTAYFILSPHRMLSKHASLSKVGMSVNISQDSCRIWTFLSEYQ